MYRPKYGFGSSNNSRRGAFRFADAAVVATLLAWTMLFTNGCDTKSAPVAKPPAPQVTVAKVECKPLVETDEFTGRLEAVDHVEIRPRVSGQLDSVHFQEGAIVQKGDLLFTIDSRPFQAEVDRLKAELERAHAQLARSQSDFARAERLHNNNGMSVEEYDRRNSARAEAEAQVASVEASLRGAELNLEFTHIVSPITGRVSRAEVTRGNLVTSGGGGPATLLTTVVSLDPVYAYFDADEQTYLKYGKQARAGKKGTNGEASGPIYLGLAGEEDFPHKGVVNFIDNQVNPTTGTIRARGVFNNKDLSLTPGLFARLKLAGGQTIRGCQIDDAAVGTDLNQKFVLVVDANNAVAYRPVTLGPIVNGLRVVRDGLHEGDVVVVNGLQRVRPGMNVTPKQVPMGSAQLSSPAGHTGANDDAQAKRPGASGK
jgi:membrane fusion protein, multidrug efflux system